VKIPTDKKASAVTQSHWPRLLLLHQRLLLPFDPTPLVPSSSNAFLLKSAALSLVKPTLSSMWYVLILSFLLRRNSIIIFQQNCKRPNGDLGVCCNPEPIITTPPTTPPPPPTTAPSVVEPTAPSYATCTAVQECVSAQVCSSRPGQTLTQFNVVI